MNDKFNAANRPTDRPTNRLPTTELSMEFASYSTDEISVVRTSSSLALNALPSVSSFSSFPLCRRRRRGPSLPSRACSWVYAVSNN